MLVLGGCSLMTPSLEAVKPPTKTKPWQSFFYTPENERLEPEKVFLFEKEQTSTKWAPTYTP